MLLVGVGHDIHDPISMFGSHIQGIASRDDRKVHSSMVPLGSQIGCKTFEDNGNEFSGNVRSQLTFSA